MKSCSSRFSASAVRVGVSLAFAVLFILLSIGTTTVVVVVASSLGASNSAPAPADVYHLSKLLQVPPFHEIVAIIVPLTWKTFLRISEQLKINRNKITVSGFSAGGSMATQFHVAHSSLLAGAGIFGQVYYRCGPNSLVEMALRCSRYGLGLFPYSPQLSINDALHYDQTNQIDPVSNLRGQKVYVWLAKQDEYIIPEIAKQHVDFYRKFMPLERIHLKIEERAKHLFPTEDFGAPCDHDAGQNLYLGNCGYSGAYLSLVDLLGDETIRKPPENFPVPIESQLKVFKQSEFYQSSSTSAGLAKNISSIGMGEFGHIYIPKACESGETECLLHFNFHGCEEWPLELGLNYSIHSGFLPLAEVNNIVVVFPLTTATPNNMNGCWDFFSYTGPDFATKNGKQIKVIHRMLQRIVNGDANHVGLALISQKPKF